MPRESIINFVRWVARSTSVVLFLFWGAFFVEHLQWFFNSAERPPAFVWTLQAIHLLLLIGFIVSLKWKLAGSLIVTVSALIFLSQAAGDRFLPLFSFTIIPALLYLICWLMAGKTTPAGLTGGAH